MSGDTVTGWIISAMFDHVAFSIACIHVSYGLFLLKLILIIILVCILMSDS